MDKIEKIYKILICRLPYKYHIPIKVYKTIFGVFKSSAREEKKTYKQVVNYYKSYLNNLTKKTTYRTTKYYQAIKQKSRKTPYDICALAYNPIKIAYDNISCYSNIDLTFFLLHEIAHNVLNTRNEKKCDDFAIRWTRKLIKEDIIK